MSGFHELLGFPPNAGLANAVREKTYHSINFLVKLSHTCRFSYLACRSGHCCLLSLTPSSYSLLTSHSALSRRTTRSRAYWRSSRRQFARTCRCTHRSTTRNLRFVHILSDCANRAVILAWFYSRYLDFVDDPFSRSQIRSGKQIHFQHNIDIFQPNYTYFTLNPLHTISTCRHSRQLVCMGMDFLASVAQREHYREVFSAPNFLSSIGEKVRFLFSINRCVCVLIATPYLCVDVCMANT